MRPAHQQEKEQRPIGLLGGTFDPVHNGHLRVAVEAAEHLRLDHVRLIPLATPNHRAPSQASAQERCDMLTLAVHPPLVLDRCEIERGGTSYSVETLEYFRARFPTTPLCLLLGVDAFHGLPTWHRAREVLELAHIVVAARPAAESTPHPGLDELVAGALCNGAQELHRSAAGHVYFMDIPRLPIASNELRSRCHSGRSIRYLAPDAVVDFINEKNLYRA